MIDQELIISRLQASFEQLTLKWIWCPGRNLSSTELAKFVKDVDKVNQSYEPLSYGYFDKSKNEHDRKAFLDQSIWCVIYKGNAPIGLVYNYDVGKVDGQKVIHLGLVKFIRNVGKDFIKVPYIGMALGNLMNFGPHICTNVSHLPIIIDMFSWLYEDVFPDFEVQNSTLRNEYRSVVHRLTQEYLTPILNYDESSVCHRSFVVKDSLLNSESGFATDWKTLPKSSSFLCNMFVKEWLNVAPDQKGTLKIRDDLIQVGKVNFSSLGNSRIHPVLSSLKFEKWLTEKAAVKLKWLGTKKAS